MKARSLLSVLALIIASIAPAGAAVGSEAPDAPVARTPGWEMAKRMNPTGDAFAGDVAASGQYVHVVYVDHTVSDRRIIRYRGSGSRGANFGLGARLTPNQAGASPGCVQIAAAGSNVHVVWRENGELYYRASSNNGADWTVRRRLSPVAGESSCPALAASGDYVHLVWSEYKDASITLLYRGSGDGGVNWSTQRRVGPIGMSAGLPALAATGDDVHLVFRTWSPHYIQYRHSLDGGSTWSPRRALVRTETGTSPTIAASGDHVYLAWRHLRYADGMDIRYRASSDAGATWPTRRILHRIPDMGAEIDGPDIAAAGSAVHVAWFSPETDSIYHRGSDDYGGTWSTRVRVSRPAAMSSDGQATAATPTMAYVIWTEDDTYNCYFRRTL